MCNRHPDRCAGRLAQIRRARKTRCCTGTTPGAPRSLLPPTVTRRIVKPAAGRASELIVHLSLTIALSHDSPQLAVLIVLLWTPHTLSLLPLAFKQPPPEAEPPVNDCAQQVPAEDRVKLGVYTVKGNGLFTVRLRRTWALASFPLVRQLRVICTPIMRRSLTSKAQIRLTIDTAQICEATRCPAPTLGGRHWWRQSRSRMA
jgi:hypothetical protein